MTKSQEILKDIDQMTAKANFDVERLLRDAKTRIEKYESRPIVKFPTAAFPDRIGSMILSFSKCYGMPAEYFGTTVLTVAGALLGNAYVVDEPRGGKHAPILYSVIVGKPSIGKTPAVKMMLRPLFEIEKRYRRQHEDKMRAHKQAEEDGQEEDAPSMQQVLINDATTEEIVRIMESNPRGILLYRDELKGWVSSMNKYTGGKGGDESFYLENWSNSLVKVNRVGRGVTFVEKPSCSVIGTIQPAVIKKLVDDGKEVDGFLARLLFAYPDNVQKQYYSKVKPDPNDMEWWEYVVNWIDSLPNEFIEPGDEIGSWDVTSIPLKLSKEAEDAYIKFYNKNVDEINGADDEVIDGMLGKFDSYCLRFSLIMEIMQRAIDWPESKAEVLPQDVEKWEIQELSVFRAIEVVNYYKKTALRVVNRLQSPVEQLPDKHKIWYTTLPFDEVISTEMALKVGERCNMSKSTVYRYLRNAKLDLFNNLGRSKYDRKHPD